MTTQALLLAAGLGTRLRPLTDAVPKCLIEVGGRPILDYWIDALERAGIREALINTHHLPEAVRDHIVRLNATRAIHLAEAYEPVLLGSAGTIAANRDWGRKAKQMLVIYADNLSDIDLDAMLKAHQAGGQPLTMALFRTPHPKKCGIASLNRSGIVTAFTEKPEHPHSDLANAGLYVLSLSAWLQIADMNAFDLGFDVLPQFVGQMAGFTHPGYHRDIGTPESLAQARADAETLFS